MEHLIPCAACDRHVRASEGECPFCGAAVDAARPVPGRSARRLGRAATFAFGAALAASGASSGCSGSHLARDDAGPEAAEDGGSDAGSDAGAAAGSDAGEAAPDASGADAGAVAPAYGAPPEDAGFHPLYGGAPPD